MPEFQMPLDQSEYATQWQKAKIGYFAKGYLEAMFFTECHSDNPELEDATINDLSPEAWERSLKDCAAFQAANADDIELFAYDHSDTQAGHDFWLTRNRHGAGFWDRKISGNGPQAWCDRLTDAAHAAGEVDLYKGDDGKLYLA